LRLPAISAIHFLECSGNSDYEWSHANVTVQESHGLVSCCQWTGVPLRHLIAESGLRASAKWVIAEGADAAVMARSIPIEKILEDCLLVYAQNGERLRPEQGYPLRLLVPGWEGNVNIKWLRRLHVTAEPYATREESSKYTDLLPNGSARKHTFVMEAKSVITWPSAGQQILPATSASSFVEIRGLAWSGHGRVKRVDVSVDGGRNWQRAMLDQPVLSKCLSSFRYPWQWDGRAAVIASRATDETGYVQPTYQQLKDARGLNSEYHFNGIHPYYVAADGSVENVQA
jgi:sulfane dehydrogenase subunit SoxC